MAAVLIVQLFLKLEHRKGLVSYT